MTEAELLGRAGELPPASPVTFAPLVRSPLVIPRVRNPGGAGGRRISAGVERDGAPAFAVLVEGDGRASCTRYGELVACAHAFNEALAAAERQGLRSRPAAQPVTAGELLAAGARLLG